MPDNPSNYGTVTFKMLIVHKCLLLLSRVLSKGELLTIYFYLAKGHILSVIFFYRLNIYVCFLSQSLSRVSCGQVFVKRLGVLFLSRITREPVSRQNRMKFRRSLSRCRKRCFRKLQYHMPAQLAAGCRNSRLLEQVRRHLFHGRSLANLLECGS